MKNAIVIFMLALALFACSADQIMPTPPTPGGVTMFPDNGDTLSGNFVVVKESVVGNVKIYKSGDTRILMLDETFMASGPDLKVYLSKDENAGDYRSLGSVKAASGPQTYTIPQDVDLTTYGKYVIVYCQRYSVLFGRAEMK